MNTLLERIVENLNETLYWNTGKHERIFTIKKVFFTAQYQNVNPVVASYYTEYRIYLNHHTAGCLILETLYLEDKQEESNDTWLILEEKVIKVLANYAVFGVTNLVDTATRLHRRI